MFRVLEEGGQAAAAIEAVQGLQMGEDPASERLHGGRRRLHGMSAPVLARRKIFGDLVVQHLLEEGFGGVAAGDRIPAYGLDETRRRQRGMTVARIAPEMQGKADMAHQPALLGGEHGGEPRARFKDLYQRPRLCLNSAVQRRMAGNIFGFQRHPPSAPIQPPEP
ncbi:hypothetical protein AJ88_48525 [Mesorhizobium amorphae CCBAU 01583]|nr:hypothetical protein AJ88_48525 [Mesorhizobium amorphae CCBAU 01583]